MNIQNLLKFNELFNQFRLVHRITLAVGEDRKENDAEHTCQLALISWYLIESQKLPLDLGKVLKYALCHDLVEAYAGDTYIYSSKDVLAQKHDKEQAALQQLEANFPEAKELWEALKEYETKSDEESKFVYALDKILPIMNNYQDNRRNWFRENITLDMVIRNKAEKVKVSQPVNDLWLELLEILEREKERLFPSE